MKRLFFLPYILFFISGCCQNKINVDNKQESTDKYLNSCIVEYGVQKCIENVLIAVVNSDSNQIDFPANKFYYDLTFEDRGSRRFISIIPSRWEKSMTLDFKGIIRIGHMSFLCRGDFQKDSLFIRGKNCIDVKLIKPLSYQYDSVDVRIESFAWEPTLAVEYLICLGTPIDLFVLVGQKKIYPIVVETNE